jgi:hypothetical protein
MTDPDERNTEKSEMRVMWIMTAVVVLIILGLMGFNMLTHPDWMHGLWRWACIANEIDMIQVRRTGEHASSVFEVVVREGRGETRHHVTMSQEMCERLTAGKHTPERCLEAAFRFLLDREPKESILRRFDVTAISRYFPEFEREMPRYLSQFWSTLWFAFGWLWPDARRTMCSVAVVASPGVDHLDQDVDLEAVRCSRRGMRRAIRARGGGRVWGCGS